MHKDWCGKTCADCAHPCFLDESIPCSPDCEHLGPNGETSCIECLACDALPLFQVSITYDGLICLRAKSSEDAREQVCRMSFTEMNEKSGGTWDISYGELIEE